MEIELIYLCFFAFLAGFIDSIVGGGGLIQTPAMLIFLPQVPIASLLGTGKLAGISGTTAAWLRYRQSVRLNWRNLVPTAGAAFVFSFLGARAVSALPTDLLRPLILILLIGVAVYTFLRQDFGALHAPRLTAAQEKWYGLGVGLVIGFYDGFFGPGTGSFLVFVFIGLFGYSFLAASAAAKVVNIATNLSALVYFMATDQVLYHLGLPMAICNIAGSTLGARLAINQGAGFVRVFFLLVVTGIIGKFAYDSFFKI